MLGRIDAKLNTIMSGFSEDNPKEYVNSDDSDQPVRSIRIFAVHVIILLLVIRRARDVVTTAGIHRLILLHCLYLPDYLFLLRPGACII